MTWNGKPVSYAEKGDRILSMPPEDKGLSEARDPDLPATLLARLQATANCWLVEVKSVVLCPSWGVCSRESCKCQDLSPDPELKIIQRTTEPPPLVGWG